MIGSRHEYSLCYRYTRKFPLFETFPNLRLSIEPGTCRLLHVPHVCFSPDGQLASDPVGLHDPEASGVQDDRSRGADDDKSSGLQDCMSAECKMTMSVESMRTKRSERG